MAFEAIVRRLAILPSIRNVFRRSLERHGPVEVITHSWKRHGIDYSDAWLYLHDLVSRGLSYHGEEIVGEYAQLERAWNREVDFQNFEWMLSRCR